MFFRCRIGRLYMIILPNSKQRVLLWVPKGTRFTKVAWVANGSRHQLSSRGSKIEDSEIFLANWNTQSWMNKDKHEASWSFGSFGIAKALPRHCQGIAKARRLECDLHWGTPTWIQAVMVVCFYEVLICRVGVVKPSAGRMGSKRIPIGYRELGFREVSWKRLKKLLIRNIMEYLLVCGLLEQSSNRPGVSTAGRCSALIQRGRKTRASAR